MKRKIDEMQKTLSGIIAFDRRKNELHSPGKKYQENKGVTHQNEIAGFGINIKKQLFEPALLFVCLAFIFCLGDGFGITPGSLNRCSLMF